MKYNREWFGEGFHTGFRKCLMNTDADIIVWNVINLLPKDDWAKFIDSVCAMDEGTLQEKCLDATEYFYENSASVIFYVGLRMVNNKQWKALEEWMEVVE